MVQWDMEKAQTSAEFVVTQTINVAPVDKPEPCKLSIKPGKVVRQFGSDLTERDFR